MSADSAQTLIQDTPMPQMNTQKISDRYLQKWRKETLSAKNRQKIGKKSAKIRTTFGSNNAACRTGSQVAKKNKRRRKLSAFQRGMS